jgi:hypothetical protein
VFNMCTTWPQVTLVQAPHLPPRAEALRLLTPGTDVVVEPLGAGVAVAAALRGVENGLDAAAADIIVTARAAPPFGDVVARLIAFLVPCVPGTDSARGDASAGVPAPAPRNSAQAEKDAQDLERDADEESPLLQAFAGMQLGRADSPEPDSSCGHNLADRAVTDDSWSESQSELSQIQSWEVRWDILYLDCCHTRVLLTEGSVLSGSGEG